MKYVKEKTKLQQYLVLQLIKVIQAKLIIKHDEDVYANIVSDGGLAQVTQNSG